MAVVFLRLFILTSRHHFKLKQLYGCSALDNPVTLTLDLKKTNPCLGPLIWIMFIKFGVDSSSSFPFRARTHTYKQSHRYNSTHWLLPAWISSDPQLEQGT